MSVCDLTLRGRGEIGEREKDGRDREGYGVQTRTAKNEQWAGLIDMLLCRLIRVLHFVYRRVWFLACSTRSTGNE